MDENKFKDIVDANVRGIGSETWDACPECGMPNPSISGKLYFCNFCGWHLPDVKEER